MLLFRSVFIFSFILASWKCLHGPWLTHKSNSFSLLIQCYKMCKVEHNPILVRCRLAGHQTSKKKESRTLKNSPHNAFLLSLLPWQRVTSPFGVNWVKLYFICVLTLSFCVSPHAGVPQVRHGMTSCWLAWVVRSATRTQGTQDLNVAALSPTPTLSPSSSSALSWWENKRLLTTAATSSLRQTVNELWKGRG